MCTAVIHFDTAGRVLLASNRDEWKQRPATPFGLFAPYPNVYAGRDEVAGGTWSAYEVDSATKHARIAMVLNARPGQPPDATKRSRGELPLAMLAAPETRAAMKEVKTTAYNPFWLLCGEGLGSRQPLFWVMGSDQPSPTLLQPGTHVVSNIGHNVPSDPKWKALNFAASAPPWPNQVTLDTLRKLLSASPIFVDAGPYGTRWSQLLQAEPGRPNELFISEAGEHYQPASRFML